MDERTPYMFPTLISRLKRYEKGCIADRLDPDFADAVFEGIDLIKSLFEDIDAIRGNDMLQSLTIANLKSELDVCRNELCLKCGDYKMRHKGACDDCRWRDAE